MSCEDSATPPIACTLSNDELADRSTEWTELLAQVTEREPTANGIRLGLPNTPAMAATAADLIVREVQCCAFFTFALTVDASGLRLDVSAPPEGLELVERLFGLGVS